MRVILALLARCRIKLFHPVGNKLLGNSRAPQNLPSLSTRGMGTGIALRRAAVESEIEAVRR
jgi:hypothetical protein